MSSPEEKFRNSIKKKNIKSLLTIRRKFIEADIDGTNSLDLNEFTKLIQEIECGINEDEIKELFTAFDKDKSGKLGINEFLKGIIGELSDKRKSLVKDIFTKIDKNKNGILEINDLRKELNVKNNKDVLSGKKTEEDVIQEFINDFNIYLLPLQKKLKEEDDLKEVKVTLEVFYDFYSYLSIYFWDDVYFEKNLKEFWA